MPLTSLLLLSMVLAAPAASSVQPGQPAQPPAVAAAPDNAFLNGSGADPAQSFQLLPEPSGDQSAALTPPDDVCYRIRAYIFKRDDDHAPEFVRSTTCGPRQPHTKETIWPKAKLVPAK